MISMKTILYGLIVKEMLNSLLMLTACLAYRRRRYFAVIISNLSKNVGAYYERDNAGDDGEGEGGSCGYDEESEQRNVAYLWDR
jgi:hypothetical protein